MAAKVHTSESTLVGSGHHQQECTFNPTVEGPERVALCTSNKEGFGSNEASAASEAPAKLGTTGALDMRLKTMEEGLHDTCGTPAVFASAEEEGNIAVGNVPIAIAMADKGAVKLPFESYSCVLGYDLGSIHFSHSCPEANPNYLAINSATMSLARAWRRSGGVLKVLLGIVPIVACVSGLGFWAMAFATLAMSDYPQGWMVGLGVLGFVFVTTLFPARTSAGRQSAVTIGMCAVRSECRRLNALPSPCHWTLHTDIVSIPYNGRKGRKCVRQETRYTLCVALQCSSLESEVSGEKTMN